MAVSGEQVKEDYEQRLAQLWKVAMSMQLDLPGLSRSYCREIMRIAHDQGIEIASGFYWNVCSHCGTLWLPGINCRPRLWTYRRLKGQGICEGKGKGRFLLTSSLMQPTKGTNGRQKTLNVPDAYYMVYRCMICKKSSIFDAYPLRPITEQKTITPIATITSATATVGQDPKLARLRKILRRSETSTKAPKKTAPSSLSEFLKGLGPK